MSLEKVVIKLGKSKIEIEDQVKFDKKKVRLNNDVIIDKIRIDDKLIFEKKKKTDSVKTKKKENNFIDLLNEITIIADKTKEFIKASYSTLNQNYNVRSSYNNQTYVNIGSKKYVYKGVGFSQIFIPKIQTYFVSDSGDINELTGNINNNHTASFSEVKEIQRAAKMNIGISNNYLDPELKERYDLWKLFMFNVDIARLLYDSIGS